MIFLHESNKEKISLINLLIRNWCCLPSNPTTRIEDNKIKGAKNFFSNSKLFVNKMSKGKFTAVQYGWRDDKNKWVAYTEDQNLAFELEFQKGSKKIKVDKERFIDLSLSHDEVMKNFNVVA